MDAPSPKMLKAITEALTNGIEVSLNELISLLDSRGMALDQLEEIKQFLDDWGLQLNPSIITGDFSSARMMRSNKKPTYSTETFYSEIQKGESSQIEFKSSLLFDHQRSIAQPEAPRKDMRSEGVLFSFLKTIGAFVNSGGGILFAGLDDDATAIGLEPDCVVLGCEEFKADTWELELRNQVTGKFKDGSLLNDYIDIDFVQVNGSNIARLMVHGRESLAFLKHEKVLKLFRRQGNRTMEVMIDEMEEFLDTRKQRKAS